jgi:hypothetical protein
MAESHIQAAIVQALQIHGVYFFSVPNEGHANNARRAQMLKSMGLRSGVSDLVVVLLKKVIFIEVKTATGRQSQAQKDFERTVTELGHEYHVVRSVDEMLKILEEYR